MKMKTLLVVLVLVAMIPLRVDSLSMGVQLYRAKQLFLQQIMLLKKLKKNMRKEIMIMSARQMSEKELFEHLSGRM